MVACSPIGFVRVAMAWGGVQVHHQPDPTTGRRLAEQIVTNFSSCPISEIARLGRILNKWRREVLAYFDTSGASDGGTGAMIGLLIKVHRRIARGFRNRDNYRLRIS